MADTNWKRTALLVVDVQQGLFERSAPIFQAEDLLQRIQDIADGLRDAGGSVVFIQHENTKLLLPETPGWEVHAHLRVDPVDRKVRKQHGNAFKDTPLHKMLQDLAVDTVIVTGLVSHGCVRATCLGALELGYRVILAADCHSSWRKDAAQRIGIVNTEMTEAGAVLMNSEEIALSLQ